jgi:hypothetical protein
MAMDDILPGFLLMFENKIGVVPIIHAICTSVVALSHVILLDLMSDRNPGDDFVLGKGQPELLSKCPLSLCNLDRLTFLACTDIYSMH